MKSLIVLLGLTSNPDVVLRLEVARILLTFDLPTMALPLFVHGLWIFFFKVHLQFDGHDGLRGINTSFTVDDYKLRINVEHV